MSNRKPLASVRKLFIKEAMVKTSENCSSCPLQSVETLKKNNNLRIAVVREFFFIQVRATNSQVPWGSAEVRT